MKNHVRGSVFYVSSNIRTNLTLCFTFAVYAQLLLMFNLPLFIVDHYCFGLIVHYEVHNLLCRRNLLLCFSIVNSSGYFYVGNVV
jgi:hypothetical protein